MYVPQDSIDPDKKIVHNMCGLGSTKHTHTQNCCFSLAVGSLFGLDLSLCKCVNDRIYNVDSSEHSTQLRHGHDINGRRNSFSYIHPSFFFVSLTLLWHRAYVCCTMPTRLK